MEEKKDTFKRKVACILIVVGIVYGFLALLNGRYISTDKAAFDQWTGEYVTFEHNR